MEIIEILTPQYEAAWLPWAVQYFFLIGLATTAGITAACLVFTPTDSEARRLLPSAVAALLVCGLAAPVALLADLHQPARFWHFYAHFTPWSWMSIGAVMIPIFVALTLLFAALWWMRKEGALKAVAILLILSCLGVLLYTGSEIMVIRSRPLWNTVFVPLNLALTAWLGALGFMQLIARWLAGGMDAFPGAIWRRLGLICLALLAVCGAAWVVSGLLGFDSSFDAAKELFMTYPSWRSSLIGSIILAIILLIAMSAAPQRLCNGPYSFICALFIMTAAWVFRWTLLMGVQTVPKYGAGLYLQSLAVGSEGLLGMIGILGLFIAFAAVVTWFLDRYPSYQSMNRPAAHSASI